MTTKNQNYIELPVQAEVGTPEGGFVALGFANGLFRGKDAAGNELYFYSKTFSDTVSVSFSAGDWTGSAPEYQYLIGPVDLPFDYTENLNVKVRDSAGYLVFGGVNVDADGNITLSSAVPYAGTATITGVINMRRRMQDRLL
jgi:hypothetical protein